MACIFCDFVSGKRKNHLNRYPLIKILETKNVFIFLGSPEKGVRLNQSDLLIIPKKHYELLEQVPKKILNELMSEVVYTTKILGKKYGSCHVLLNNGKDADQYVPHVHFHIIPKSKDKKIIWKNLSLKQFKKISANLEKEFKDEENEHVHCEFDLKRYTKSVINSSPPE